MTDLNPWGRVLAKHWNMTTKKEKKQAVVFN
jgi:hypothetical protein